MTNNKISILGIGNAACNITQVFEKYKDYYNCFYIDTEAKENQNLYNFQANKSFEKYEQLGIDANLSNFFSTINSELLVFITGGGSISGCCLSVLQQIKDCKITIVYIKPEEQFLTERQKMQHVAAYNILQQYARSGLFESMIIVENNLLEQCIDSFSLLDYYDKINEFLVYILHLKNCAEKSKPLLSFGPSKVNAARLETLAIISGGEEKLFFNLDKVKEKRYSFIIDGIKPEKHKEYVAQIRQHLGQESKEKKISTQCGFYTFGLKEEMQIVLYRSMEIQK